jgi:hypothetical protein
MLWNLFGVMLRHPTNGDWRLHLRIFAPDASLIVLLEDSRGFAAKRDWP